MVCLSGEITREAEEYSRKIFDAGIFLISGC